MSNPWFRMYSEFANDPKVQMMSEVMQRRYIMLMCLRCSNTLVTLHETEIAFQLRISDEDMAETKALFIKKGFIDSEWNLLNWDKRQFASDTSKSRVAKHRALQKEKQIPPCNADVTLQKRNDNGLDTDTDTDTDKKEEPKGSMSPDKLPPCPRQSIVDLYHQVLPELPSVRIVDDNTRGKAISNFWKFALTSKKPDGQRRATDAESALAWTKSYFERASENDFLMGRTDKDGKHRNWKADLDFLMTNKGLKHVIERTDA